MDARVGDLRLAFLWTQFRDDLFAEPVPNVPFAFLGRDYTYADRFASMKDYQTEDPDGLTPPWPQHRGKHFWGMYLGRDPHVVDAWRAWKHFVPFRLNRPVHVDAPWLPGRVETEGFFYPHGYALHVDVRLRPESEWWTLEEAVEQAHDVRDGRQFTVTTGGSEKTMKLDSFAAVALDRLGEIGYGGPRAGTVTGPYTVVTFVRVAGVDATVPVESGGAVHRALEALTGWSGAWRIAPLPPLGEAAIQDPRLPASHVHYHHRGGRAAWFPGLADASVRHRKMSCYHRNQTFAALQVASLTLLAARTAARDRAGQPLPLSQEQCARNAVGLLGRLYGSGNDTYRSLACRDHLREAGSVADVDYLRTEVFGIEPLHVGR